MDVLAKWQLIDFADAKHYLLPNRCESNSQNKQSEIETSVGGPLWDELARRSLKNTIGKYSKKRNANIDYISSIPLKR